MAERIEFSCSLYSVDAVKQAVEAFAHLGKLEIEAADDAVTVVLSDPDPEVADVLLDELGNHALALTVQSRG